MLLSDRSSSVREVRFLSPCILKVTKFVRMSRVGIVKRSIQENRLHPGKGLEKLYLKE